MFTVEQLDMLKISVFTISSDE